MKSTHAAADAAISALEREAGRRSTSPGAPRDHVHQLPQSVAVTRMSPKSGAKLAAHTKSATVAAAPATMRPMRPAVRTGSIVRTEAKRTSRACRRSRVRDPTDADERPVDAHSPATAHMDLRAVPVAEHEGTAFEVKDVVRVACS